MWNPDLQQRGTNDNKNVSSAFRSQLELADVADRDKYPLLFFTGATLLGLGTALSSVTGSDPGQGLFGVLVLIMWTNPGWKRGERRRRYRAALSLQLPLNRLRGAFFHGRHLGHRYKLLPVWCDWKGQRAESVWEVLQPVAWVSIYQPTWVVSSAQV